MAQSLLIAGAALAGLIFGSHLATILLRWPQARSALGGRSHCDSCHHVLGAADLVPLLSFARTRGRCRFCGARISTVHPLVEAAAALMGVVAILAHPLPLAVVTAALGWWLLLIGALDARHQWLPDRLTLPLLAAGLAVAAAGAGPPLVDRAIGAVAGYLVLAAIAAGYRRLRGREGLGGGDSRLLAAIGAWLGWASLPLVLVGAGAVGLGLVAWSAARGRPLRATDRLPLGSLMAVAAWPIWLVTAAGPGL